MSPTSLSDLPREIILEIASHLTPLKDDVKAVMSLLALGLISREDVKDMYFIRVWKFREEDFALARWRDMTVGQMEVEVRSAHPFLGDRLTLEEALHRLCAQDATYASHMGRHRSPHTREEIMREYGCLAYVPKEVYSNTLRGAHILRMLSSAEGIEELKRDLPRSNEYLIAACRAGLDPWVVQKLVDECGATLVSWSAGWAAKAGHNEVIDLLIERYHVAASPDLLFSAAERGQNHTIDHLVQAHGLSPHAVNENGWCALYSACQWGRIHTIRLLVETYRVDFRAATSDGNTAWTLAQRYPDCLRLLSSYLTN